MRRRSRRGKRGRKSRRGKDLFIHRLTMYIATTSVPFVICITSLESEATASATMWVLWSAVGGGEGEF